MLRHRPRFLVRIGRAGAALALAWGGGAAARAADAGPVATPPDVSDPLLVAVAAPAKRLESFQQARDLLEHRSPDLAQARADIERARGVYRQALAGVLPSLTGTASYTRRPLQPTLIPGVTPPGYTYLTQVVASERVVAPGSWGSIAANERDITRAQLASDDVRRRVYGGLAEALLAVVVTERTAELGRDGLRSALQTAALWEKRRSLGVGTDLDLARLAQDVAAARLAVIERNEAVERAREALGLSLGFTEAWGVTAQVDSAAVQSAVRSVCTPVSEPAERSDVAAAAAAVDVSRRLVRKAELDFAPTVDIVTTLGMQPRSFVSTEPAANLQIAGVLSWSIWDGGNRYGSLRIAKANVDAAEARHDKVRREAELQGRQTHRAIEVAEQALRAATDSRARAVETDRLVRTALQQGTGSTLDLVQAQQLVRRADTEVALREFELVRARVEQFLVSSRCSP